MRRLWTAPLLFAALFALALDPPPADAQTAVKPTEESFKTADGVRLKGLFHKSPNGGKQGDAVVMLLYPPGGVGLPERSMLKGNWDPLIDKLTEEGFHVFRFDWRGHGGSTDIVDPLGDNMPIGGVLYSGFFTNGITGSWNQKFVKDGSKAKKPNEIKVKGGGITGPGYFPVYVNDLAAARLHLDQKNDNNEVNTSSVYVIGAGDTATLGMLWISSEWQRPATHPMLPAGLQYLITPMRGIVVNPPAGADVAGAVWLSASRPASAGINDAMIKGWAKSSIKLRDNNKMLFLYGKDDAAADRDSKFFFDQVLVAGGNKAAGLAQVEQTFRVDVGKTKLSGVDMLGSKDVNAEVKIVDYLKARQKDRVNMVRKNRNYISPYYVDVNYYLH
jgi:pimeloyl-ACP methyl ester carboxylesterase